MLKKFPFLTSNRFWAVVLIAIAGYLQSAGFSWNPESLADAFKIIAGAHIAIRSIDRFGEQSSKKR